MSLLDWILDRVGAVLAFAVGFLLSLVALIFLHLFGVSFWISAALLLGGGILFLFWEYFWDSLLRGTISLLAPKDAGEEFSRASKRSGWIGNYGLLLGIVAALFATRIVEPVELAQVLGMGGE